METKPRQRARTSSRPAHKASGPVLDRIAPGARGRIRAAFGAAPKRRGVAPRLGGIGPESARRVEAMLSEVPDLPRPRGMQSVEAARDLEPVHSGLRDLLAYPGSALRVSPGWAAYRDAVCRASGQRPSTLASIVARLRAISDAFARDRLMPLVEGAPEGWDSEADMRTAAARILWGRKSLLACLSLASAWERDGRLPPRLAALDDGGWARQVRAEAERLHGDPEAWWVPAR